MFGVPLSSVSYVMPYAARTDRQIPRVSTTRRNIGNYLNNQFLDHRTRLFCKCRWRRWNRSDCVRCFTLGPWAAFDFFFIIYLLFKRTWTTSIRRKNNGKHYRVPKAFARHSTRRHTVIFYCLRLPNDGQYIKNVFSHSGPPINLKTDITSPNPMTTQHSLCLYSGFFFYLFYDNIFTLTNILQNLFIWNVNVARQPLI